MPGVSHNHTADKIYALSVKADDMDILFVLHPLFSSHKLFISSESAVSSKHLLHTVRNRLYVTVCFHMKTDTCLNNKKK